VELVIVLLLIALIGALVVRPFLSIVTVHDYQRGLRYRQGRLVGLVEPGTHVALRPLTEIQLLDARPTSITVPGQEILTSDGVSLRVSLTARYVVADPVAAFRNDQNYVGALYTALHGGLREVLAGRTTDEILGARSELGPAVGGAVASELARLGVVHAAGQVAVGMDRRPGGEERAESEHGSPSRARTGSGGSPHRAVRSGPLESRSGPSGCQTPTGSEGPCTTCPRPAPRRTTRTPSGYALRPIARGSPVL
jgi:hypothetical protein